MLEVVVAALEAVAEICSRGSSVCKLVTESVLPLLEHEGSMVFKQSPRHSPFPPPSALPDPPDHPVSFSLLYSTFSPLLATAAMHKMTFGLQVRHAAVLCLKKTADLRDKSICKV